MLVIAIIGCAPIRPLSDKIRSKIYADGTVSTGWRIVQISLYCLAFLGLFYCILRLSPSGYNPFIYFRF